MESNDFEQHRERLGGSSAQQIQGGLGELYSSVCDTLIARSYVNPTSDSHCSSNLPKVWQLHEEWEEWFCFYTLAANCCLYFVMVFYFGCGIVLMLLIVSFLGLICYLSWLISGTFGIIVSVMSVFFIISMCTICMFRK